MEPLGASVAGALAESARVAVDDGTDGVAVDCFATGKTEPAISPPFPSLGTGGVSRVDAGGVTVLTGG
jgi:hypothetical protein